MPEDQEAKNEACQKARRTRPEGQKNKARGPEEQGQQGQKRPHCWQGQARPHGQERPRAGDLAKERVKTEKFQQLEQENSNKMLGVPRC
jgi:hypothetical protein